MNARQPWLSALPAETALPEIRDAAATDRDAVAAMLAGMDRDGLWQRHFSGAEILNTLLLDRLAAADGRNSAVALARLADGRVVGHAEYAPGEEAGAAEMAVMVLPEWRRIGIASSLCRHLAVRARAAGFRAVAAYAQSTNRPMLALATRLGFSLCRDADPRLTRFAWPLG